MQAPRDLPAWTVAKALTYTQSELAAAGIHTAEVEAAWLVAHVLSVDRVALLLNRTILLSPDALSALVATVARRADREPLQYVLGETEFFSLPFLVEPTVLIPRPETETLLEVILEAIDTDRPVRALDVGTGSGCIAVVLAHTRSRSRVLAIDQSRPALEVARRNAHRNSVADRVHLACGDLRHVPARRRTFDWVVANPPYVRTGDLSALDPEVRDWEPFLALDGGPDGLVAYRSLVGRARDLLRPGGRLAVELPGVDPDPVAGVVSASGAFSSVSVRCDLAGRPRVLVASVQA